MQICVTRVTQSAAIAINTVRAVLNVQKSLGSLKISYETIFSEKTFSQFLRYFRQDWPARRCTDINFAFNMKVSWGYDFNFRSKWQLVISVLNQPFCKCVFWWYCDDIRFDTVRIQNKLLGEWWPFKQISQLFRHVAPEQLRQTRHCTLMDAGKHSPCQCTAMNETV